MTDNEKHSSLQRYRFNYARKMFYCEGLQGFKDFTQLNLKINLKLVMAGNNGTLYDYLMNNLML